MFGDKHVNVNPLLNEVQQSNILYTSSNVLFWFLSPPSNSFLPANTGTPTTNIVVLSFGAGSFFDSNFIGEAPQLSCTNPTNTLNCNYAEFDTGNMVFGVNGLYENFLGNYGPSNTPTNTPAGLSLCTDPNPQWCSGPTTGYVQPTYSISNSLKIIQGNNHGGTTDMYFLSNQIFSPPMTAEIFVSNILAPDAYNIAVFQVQNPYNSSERVYILQQYSNGITNWPAANTVRMNYFNVSGLYGLLYNSVITGYFGGVGFGAFTGGNPLGVSSITYMSSNTANSMLSNDIGLYARGFGLTDNVLISNGVSVSGASTYNEPTANANTVLTSMQMGFGSDDSGTVAGQNVIYQWARFRVAPPNDIMPSTSFGAFNTTTPLMFNSLTISSPGIDGGQTQTLMAYVYNGVSPYTYNIMVFNSLVEVANQLASSALTHNAFAFTQNSAWGTGTFMVNVIVTDSSSGPTTVSNTLFYSYTANMLPSITLSNTPSPKTIDAGNTITFNALVTGGTGPYTYSFYVYNSVTKSTVNTVTQSSSTFVFSTNTALVGNTFDANVFVTDAVGSTANSALTGIWTVNAFPTIMLSPTTNTIDAGQSVTFSNTVTGGTGAVSYAYTINAVSGFTQSGNQFTFSAAGTYNILETVTDGLGSTAYSSNSVITVNPAPSISSSPGTTSYDLGNTISQTATISGGSPQFTYNQIIWSGATVVYNSLSPYTASTTNSIALSASSLGAGTYTYNVIVNDQAYSPETFNTVSYVLTINPTLAVGSPSPTSPVIDSGQSVTLASPTPSGGSGGYAYKWSASPSCASFFGGTSSTQAVSPTSSNTYYVQVTDSLGSTVCSSGATVTVHSAPLLTSFTPNNAVINYGQSVAYNIILSGGTGPFTLNLINTTTDAVVNTISWPTLAPTSNLILFGSTVPIYASSAYNVIGIDDGTTSQVTFTSTSNTITVNNISTTSTTTISQGSPASTAGGVGSLQITSITTTAATTTISAASTTTIPALVNSTYNIASTPTNVALPRKSGTISISSGTPVLVHLRITNITSTATPLQSNITIAVFNIVAVTADNITINETIILTMTLKYQCSIPSGAIAPYELEGGSWIVIKPFTVNSAACTVTFQIPPDPVVGLFESQAQVPATTTPFTTAATTSVAATQQVRQSNDKNYIIIGIVAVVIIVIISAAYYLISRKRRMHK